MYIHTNYTANLIIHFQETNDNYWRKKGIDLSDFQKYIKQITNTFFRLIVTFHNIIFFLRADAGSHRSGGGGSGRHHHSYAFATEGGSLPGQAWHSKLEVVVGGSNIQGRGIQLATTSN